MKSTRSRVVGAVIAVAVVALGLSFSSRSVSAATAVYTCKGDDGRVTFSGDYSRAALQTLAPGNYVWYSSKGLLSSLSGTLAQNGIEFPVEPSLEVDFDGTAPSGVVPGEVFEPSFTVTANLPQQLIDNAAGLLGMSSANVKATWFEVDTTPAGKTVPETVRGDVADQTVPLVKNQPTSVSATATGQLETVGAPGSLILYRPGTARVELEWPGGFYIGTKLINGVWVPINLKVYKLILNCEASLSPIIKVTNITNGGVTTTTSGPTTTTSTTTTSTTTTTTSTTTTAAPTTTTTTAAPTTTTTTAAPTTTTTTAAPTTTTTTAAPTTTLQPPPLGDDEATVSVGAFRYQNGGRVDGPGFDIVKQGSTVMAVSGAGTMPGTSGGTASIAVNVARQYYWTFGQVAVSDPGAGVNLVAYRSFGGGLPNFGNSTRVTASWFLFDWTNGIRPYTIDATITDNG